MIKYFLICILLVLLYFYIVSRPFKSDYLLKIIFGRKGSGKSTLLTKYSVMFNRLGWHVFSDSPIFGTYKLNPDWIGVYDFPENSVLLIDEGAIVFHQRNWKQFKNTMKDFFVLQRHKRVYVIVASQSFNLDKVVRDLSDCLYLCVNYLGIFTVAKKIHRGVKLANQESDSEGFIGDSYTWELPWHWDFVYIPRWVKFFNSFRSDPLPQVRRVKWKFENEPYLYKLTKWKFYKYDQIKDVVHSVSEWVDRHRSIEKFKISSEKLEFLTMRRYLEVIFE